MAFGYCGLSSADEGDIWKVNGYFISTSSNAYIPILEGEAATNSQKTDILTRAFFPQPPPVDLSDIPGATYPDSIPTKLIITGMQVKRAIEKLAPNKGPEPDEILNHILKHCLSILQPPYPQDGTIKPLYRPRVHVNVS